MRSVALALWSGKDRLKAESPLSHQNTNMHYGSVAKVFHWTTAFLILTAIPLGLVANKMAISPDTLALKAQLFSLHKTVGVTAFFVALARILWAIFQPKPALLNSEKPVEAFLAETVHWLLYASLVIVPLSGWLHHAATSGFAPILWPLPQDLPLVAKSETLAGFFSALHLVFTKILGFAVVLHIAGALKHHVIDKDATLRRMWFGTSDISVAPAAHHSRAPIFAAFVIYALAMGVGSFMGLKSHDDTGAVTAPALQATDDRAPDASAFGWTVENGTLGLSVTQFGNKLEGAFSGWSAEIRFDDVTADTIKGHVRVEIDIASLTLGSVTQNALGTDFFDAATFPSAVFEGPITGQGNDYTVEGTLTLKDASVPVTLPFTLRIEDDVATMSGSVDLDRRDFGIGATYPDEGTVGFGVTVPITLTARPSG